MSMLHFFGRFRRHALQAVPLLVMLGLAGCLSEPPVSVPVTPAPQLPVTVKVPVPVQLPFAMKQPCLDPAARPVTTDAELLAAADAWKVAKRCSDAKLRAIDEAEKKATTP